MHKGTKFEGGDAVLLDHCTISVKHATVLRQLADGYAWIVVGGGDEIKVHSSRLTHVGGKWGVDQNV